LVLAILTISGITSGVLFAKEVRANARLRLDAQTETMMISLSDRLIDEGQLTTADVERLAPPRTEVVLRTTDGALVARTGPVLAEKVMSIEVRGPGDLSATVSADSAPIDRRVHDAWRVIIGVGFAVAIVAAGAALLEARHLSRPLDRLAHAAVQLGGGDSGVVVPRSGVIEVDAIAEALEESGKRVAELMAAERQFSANASHQLRSPLTAIAISLELIADSDDPVASREASEALTQVAGLDDRINELLNLARTGRVAAPARTNVAAVVDRHVHAIAAQFNRVGRKVRFISPSVVEADVTAAALTQSVEILLDNALVHGAGNAEVRVTHDGDVIHIAISDEGRIREPGDDERGHGLGLLLARNLLRPDGGRIQLVSTSPTRFVIELPAVPGARPASSPDLLAHEGGVGGSEQDDHSADEGDDLPPGEDEALGQRQRARESLRSGVVLDDEAG
jgi:signal transduction histidine kinase